MAFSMGEILGSLGVAILLFAFLMNLIKKWKQDELPYIFSNIIGAALSCASSIVIHFWPFIILEATWAIVSIIALVNYFKQRG